MPNKYYNRVAFNTATTGQGTLNVGTAIGSNFCTPVEAGAVTSDTVDYLITEGTDFEIGTGTLTSGTPWTLSRTTVHLSKIAGAAGTLKMTLAGAAQVRLISSAAEFTAFAATDKANAFTNITASTSSTTGSATFAGGVGIAGDLFVGGNIDGGTF